MKLRIIFSHCIGALFLSCLAQNVAGQTYPDRQISLVVPGAASGGMDVIARALADRLSLTLKQSIMVDNRPGAILQLTSLPNQSPMAIQYY